MSLEKKLRPIPPQPFTQDGSSSGVIKVLNATLFKVEQDVVLKSDTQENLQLAVKDILDKTTLAVGVRGRPLSAKADVSMYLLSDNASIEAPGQERPMVLDQDVQRSTFEEAPTVARRTFLVDVLGNPVDSSNPLPVDATFTGADFSPNNVTIFRIAYPTADVEVSQVLPAGTRKLYVGPEKMDTKMRIAFIPNGTTDITNRYSSVVAGNSYYREGMKFTGKTLYFRAAKGGIVIEIEAWF